MMNRSHDEMPDRLEFRCPVCRARQQLQECCRRCKADLRLVVRAHRRAGYLNTEIENARADGDWQREELLAAELQWLDPNPR